MPLISRNSIDQVLAAADMVEIVGHYTQLKKSGANYMGCCPFHEEKTPSFSVNPVEKLYYCFGCGEGGNLFSFVQRKEDLDFAAAVEHLADKLGIVLEYEQTDARGEAERRRRERLRALLEQSTAYYERVLWQGTAAATARAYLAGRGFGDEICRAYRVGFAPPGWQTLRDAAAAKGFSDEELLEAGLVVPGRRDRPYDRFRERVVFPLADDRGRTLGFGARTLGDEKPKYLNSPETALYHKSEALFGLHTAKKAAQRADRIYVVEGYTDVLALAQAGVQEVVAAMGTALTEQQLTRLSRLTRQLYLCFDADAAGLGAMSRALTLARRLGLTMYVVRMPEGLDPADYLTGGASGDDFRRLADDAESVLHYRVRQVLDSHDLERSDGRAQAFAQLKGVLADTASPTERDDEVRHIAGRLRLSEESVRYLLRSGGGATQAARAGAAAPAPGAAVVTGGAHELEVRFLAACLAVPEAGEERLAGIDDEYFASAETRAARRWTAARLALRNAGKKTSAAETAEGEDDGSEVVAEVVLRSGQEPFTTTVLDELFLRLQEAHVGRRIARLKVETGAGDTASGQEQLARLQEVRRRLREAIRRLPVEE
ncbi:MAG TPA: DNA primase [Thermoleophilia bacterium]|nr:DNA primase [Thermoleophilia bacterium]